MAKILKLTENDLHKIVKESVIKILIKEGFGSYGQPNRHSWTVEFYADECGQTAEGVSINEPPGITNENWRNVIANGNNNAAKEIYSQIYSYLKRKYPGLRNIKTYRRNNNIK